MEQQTKIPGGNELLNPHDLIKNKLAVTYGSTIADLGCGGSGFFVLQSSQIVGPQGIVYAVDILKSALSNVSTRAKLLGLNNIKTIWSDLEKVGVNKINNETVDYSLLINVLFQNKNYQNILNEATRILKRGGKLLVVDWLFGRFPIGPKPEDKVQIEKVIEMTNEFGLTLEKQFEAGKFHYGVVFIKN